MLILFLTLICTTHSMVLIAWDAMTYFLQIDLSLKLLLNADKQIF